MYSELKLQYYRVTLLQTKRGNSKGILINAKPIFLIALFDCIEKGLIGNNKILFEDKLQQCYEYFYRIYEPEKPITPFHKPFYHLQTDSYWHLHWDSYTERKAKSAKNIRDNVKYASFDNALWDLLQDAESRNILRDTVISYFLTQKSK